MPIEETITRHVADVDWTDECTVVLRTRKKRTELTVAEAITYAGEIVEAATSALDAAREVLHPVESSAVDLIERMSPDCKAGKHPHGWPLSRGRSGSVSRYSQSDQMLATAPRTTPPPINPKSTSTSWGRVRIWLTKILNTVSTVAYETSVPSTRAASADALPWSRNKPAIGRTAAAKYRTATIQIMPRTLSGVAR